MADGLTDEQRQRLAAMVHGPSGPAGGTALPVQGVVQPSGPAGGSALPLPSTVQPSGRALPQVEVGLPRMGPRVEVGMPRIGPRVEVGEPRIHQKLAVDVGTPVFEPDQERLAQIKFRREREEALKRGELVPVYEVHGGDEPYAVVEDANGKEFFVPAFGPNEGQFFELPKGDFDIGELIAFARGTKPKAKKPEPVAVVAKR